MRLGASKYNKILLILFTSACLSICFDMTHCFSRYFDSLEPKVMPYYATKVMLFLLYIQNLTLQEITRRNLELGNNSCCFLLADNSVNVHEYFMQA